MPREKTSVKKTSVIEVSVKFTMYQASAILLKETGSLKQSRRSYTKEEKI